MRKAERPRSPAADGVCEEALGIKDVQVQKPIADPAGHIPCTSAHPRCRLTGSRGLAGHILHTSAHSRCRLAGSRAHWDFPVSASSLTVKVPGSQTQSTLSGITWVPETQVQVLTHVQLVPHMRSHFLGPRWFFSAFTDR